MEGIRWGLKTVGVHVHCTVVDEKLRRSLASEHGKEMQFGSDEGGHWVLLIVDVCLFAGIDRQLDTERLMGEIHFFHVRLKWASRSGLDLRPRAFTT